MKTIIIASLFFLMATFASAQQTDINPKFEFDVKIFQTRMEILKILIDDTNDYEKFIFNFIRKPTTTTPYVFLFVLKNNCRMIYTENSRMTGKNICEGPDQNELIDFVEKHKNLKGDGQFPYTFHAPNGEYSKMLALIIKREVIEENGNKTTYSITFHVTQGNYKVPHRKGRNL